MIGIFHLCVLVGWEATFPGKRISEDIATQRISPHLVSPALSSIRSDQHPRGNTHPPDEYHDQLVICCRRARHFGERRLPQFGLLVTYADRRRRGRRRAQ